MRLRDFIPSVLVQMARLLKPAFSKPNHVVYPNWQSAILASSEKAYENSELISVIYEKTRIYAAKLSTEIKPTDLDPLPLYGYFALQLAGRNKNLISVLDLGGACGAHYFLLRRLLPRDVVLRWIVLETPEMAKAGSRLATDELVFISDVESRDLPSRLDLLYVSGVLQYLSDPFQLLSRILKIHCNFALFLRLSLVNSDRPLITVQHSSLASNGVGPLPPQFQDREIKYPHVMLPESQFRSAIEEYYDPLYMIQDRSGMIGLQNEIGYGLIATRKHLDK